MKLFFIELVEYNHWANKKVIEALEKNSSKITEKCLQLTSHVINGHAIWNNKILATNNLIKPWDVHSLDQLATFNLNNYEDSLSIIQKHELDQTIEYALSSGKTFTHTVHEILFQALNHSTYHRAQIATEFRKMDIHPLMTDYIYYKIMPR